MALRRFQTMLEDLAKEVEALTKKVDEVSGHVEALAVGELTEKIEGLSTRVAKLERLLGKRKKPITF